MTRSCVNNCDRAPIARGLCSYHYHQALRLAQKKGQWSGRQPAVGTTRRLRALVAIGYSPADLQRHLGIGTAIGYLLAGTRPTVNHTTATRVQTLYNELSMIPGPKQSARDLAVQRGWAPPLAWDEDSIDSPEATPNPGRHETLTFRDRYLELRDCGYNDLFIAQRLNIRPESLARQLLRHNMPISDLLQTEITATKNRTPSGAA